jgi:mycothiol synthase
VGHLWWGPDSEDSAVLDARLDDPGRVAELLPALQRLAREDAARRIGVGGIPADQTLTALAGLPGFVTRGTNMELWLEQAVGDPGPVELRTMTQEEFDVFFHAMLTGYTAELVAAGISEERATEHARTQSAELVPDGLASPHAHFFTGWVEDQSVGRLWIGTERPMAFVYELEVREDQRRKGYGEAIMNAGARWCQDRGIFALGLNVFGHNPGARRLYDKLGYEVTLDYRTLDVDDVPDAG